MAVEARAGLLRLCKPGFGLFVEIQLTHYQIHPFKQFRVMGFYGEWSDRICIVR